MKSRFRLDPSLGSVVLPVIAVIGLAVLFVWAGVPMMTVCLGMAVVWVPCLLVFLCACVYPLLKSK